MLQQRNLFISCYNNAHYFGCLLTQVCIQSTYSVLITQQLSHWSNIYFIFSIICDNCEKVLGSPTPKLEIFLTLLLYLVLLQHTHKTQPKSKCKDIISIFISKLSILSSHSFPISTLNSSSLGFLIHKQLLDKQSSTHNTNTSIHGHITPQHNPLNLRGDVFSQAHKMT